MHGPAPLYYEFGRKKMARQLHAQQGLLTTNLPSRTTLRILDNMLWALLLLSLLAGMYLKFVNRYHMIWIDQLERQAQSLAHEHDNLMLKEEKLLANSRVEQVAAKQLGLYIPAKHDIKQLSIRQVEA